MKNGKLALAAFAFAGTLLIGGGTVTKAATDPVRPSAALLHKSASYYKTHYKTLSKHYRIYRSLQTGINKNGQIKLYVRSANVTGDMRVSLKLAVNYWNQKLGTNVIKLSANKGHSAVFAAVAKGTDKTEDAYWNPNNKQLALDLKPYEKSLSSLTEQMTDNYSDQLDNELNAAVQKYADSMSSSIPGYNDKVQAYKDSLTAQNQDKLSDAQQTIQDDNLGYVSRNLYYGAVLAHEMGHALGLNHSPNTKDAMNAYSDSPQSNDYEDVLNSTNKGYNPLTKTDVMRAQLALKIFKAYH